MRIGFVCVRDIFGEFYKEESVYLDDPDRPWLKQIKNKNHYETDDDGRKFTSLEYDVGYCLKKLLPKAVIDFIEPDDISVKRFHQSDLVFVLIYDLLEALYTEPIFFYNKYKTILKNCKNVYPPYEYQKFINSKCMYYGAYQKLPNVHVVPSQCVCKRAWKSQDQLELCKSILDKAKKQKWKNLFMKAEHGQESIYTDVIPTYSDPRRLMSMLEKKFQIFDGVVVQKFIDNFEGSWEYRMYFINGQYICTAGTKDDEVGIFEDEDGSLPKPKTFAKMKKMAENAIKALPPIIVNGRKLPALVNRCDMIDCADEPNNICISEVEFTCRLYL